VEQRALELVLLHKSFVARGARRAGGQFRGASVDRTGMACSLECFALHCTDEGERWRVPFVRSSNGE
jgi:hypothetical protein